ncbi:hypothetical protein EZS27_014797 [termite gut metagenome]|uniref:Lipocalin-like domain-containing protein n=1 Tax=termite gut metagenome TaxID=433724 RepID=A0A5J4RUZ6_9ZZZZ
MKNLKFLQIVLVLALCSCGSCEDEDKLPGTKPEMLIGKWESLQNGGLFFDAHTWLERYEFTETGGFMVKTYYDPIAKVFLDPDTLNYFANWSFSVENETIYFENYRGSRWTLFAKGLTSDSIFLGCNDCIYYKIKE